MGGKSYHCDYCNCFMKNDINVRKSHNIGMLHNIAKANYLAKYKDAEQIITEETNKIPCSRFSNNKQCQFGAFCRYSHYSLEELTYLKWKIHEQQNTTIRDKLPKNLPWKYQPYGKHLHEKHPPSMQAIDFDKITVSCFLDQWG